MIDNVLVGVADATTVIERGRSLTDFPASLLAGRELARAIPLFTCRRFTGVLVVMIARTFSGNLRWPTKIVLYVLYTIGTRDVNIVLFLSVLFYRDHSVQRYYYRDYHVHVCVCRVVCERARL